MSEAKCDVLLVMAQQDDEVFLSARLEVIRGDGARVKAIWITDGAKFVPA